MVTKYYASDTTDGICLGEFINTSPDAALWPNAVDALTPASDPRMTWNGSAWSLPTAVKEQDERDWRSEEFSTSDKYALSDVTMTAATTTYRQELRDMPVLTGFPDTHTRPVRPVGE